VYGELHRIAVGKLRLERPAHTLQPTALVNETYLKMMGKGAVKTIPLAITCLRNEFFGFLKGDHRDQARAACTENRSFS
jgi:hypothetical protein